VHHHGEALRALTKDEQLLASVERDPAGAPLDELQRAIVDYAIKLTRSPRSITRQDIDRLRNKHLSDAAIHDIAATTAYFNFVNRVALGLGVELEGDPA
jgi:uncharacterized peroxidase-related enzyme